MTTPTVRVAKPQEQAKHTVKKTGASTGFIAAGLAKHAAYLTARDAYLRWSQDAEECGKAYVAQWCAALAKANPSWTGSGGEAKKAIDVDAWAKFVRGRAREDREKKEKVEQAAEEVAKWIEANDAQLRKAGVKGIDAIPQLFDGLSESEKGRAFLRRQALDKGSLFAWLGSSKPAPEESVGETLEQRKKALEVCFAETFSEVSVEMLKDATKESEGFQVLKGLVSERYGGLALVISEKKLQVIGYAGPIAQARVMKVPQVWVDGATHLPSKVLSALMPGLVVVNTILKLRDLAQHHDFEAVAGSAQSTLELAGQFKDAKKAMAAFADGSRMRIGQAAHHLAGAAESKSLVKLVGEEFAKEGAKGCVAGVFVAMCDVAISGYKAGKFAADGQSGEAAVQLASAGLSMATMIGLAMLPVPGLDLIGAGLVVTGTVGGFALGLVAAAIAEPKLHNWARHSAFGTTPQGTSIEQQIDALHEALYEFNVANCTVAEGAIHLEIELSNVSLRSKVGLVVLTPQKTLVRTARVAPNKACKLLPGPDGSLKSIELELEMPEDQPSLELSVRVIADVHGDKAVVITRDLSATARAPGSHPVGRVQLD